MARGWKIKKGVIVPDAGEEIILQRQVVEYARLTRHLVFHDYDSRRNARGLPDLLIVPTRRVANPTMFFWELKSTEGELTKEQLEWLEALKRIKHVEARVIRPNDLAYVQDRLASQ